MSNEYKCYVDREIDTDNRPSIHVFFLKLKKLNIYEFSSKSARDEAFLVLKEMKADKNIKMFKSFWREDRQKHTIELEGENVLKQLEYINSIDVSDVSLIKCEKEL